MILPIFILIADVLAWWLASDIAAQGDETLTWACVGFAIGLLAWLLIEVYQLGEATFRRPGADSDSGE